LTTAPPPPPLPPETLDVSSWPEEKENATLESDEDDCRPGFLALGWGFVGLWSAALATEVAVAAVAIRGTVFDDSPRVAAEYLLYFKLGESSK